MLPVQKRMMKRIQVRESKANKDGNAAKQTEKESIKMILWTLLPWP